MKLNKKHQGKEFKSFFHFVGLVSNHVSGIGQDSKENPIFEERASKNTGRPLRKLQFDVETAKHNKLKVELMGMEKEFAYLYSSKHKLSKSIKWADRLNKEAYPDETYHYLVTEWDLSKEVADQVKAGDWVEVKGKYQFETMTNDEGKEILLVKRIINECNVIEDGAEIKQGKDAFNYVCDFDSPDFKEVNYANLEIGIKSTYQDENTKDTIVNAVFLDYGKEKSTPKDVKLTVFHKDVAEGKKSLADIFANFNKYDFIEVEGVDNNRPVFSEVEDTTGVDDSFEALFGDLDETAKSTKTKNAISGNKKGLEITKVLATTYKKELLTEEEFTKQPTAEEIFNNANNDTAPFEADNGATDDFLKELGLSK